MRAPRLLIVTRHTPLPWEDGAGAYLHTMAHHLAGAGFRVSVLWLAPHDHLRWKICWMLPSGFSPRVALHLPGAVRLGRRRFFFPAVLWQPFRARVLGWVRRQLRRLAIDPPRRHPAPANASSPTPNRWASPPSSRELTFVQRFAATHHADVVIASYAWLCPLLALPAFHDSRRVCLTHDIGWKRAALAATDAPAEVSRVDEITWLKDAALVIAISPADAAALTTLAPHAHILVAPKAVSRIPPAPASDSVPHALLFVGADNAFNIEGLTWFLQAVWPLVVRDRPDASLHVCGTIARSVHARPAGVVFHGLVPLLDRHYASAAVVIAPLLRATGLNIKLVDAAAAGRAIVATSATLVGAPFLLGCVELADTPLAFASAVGRLLNDPAARARMAARALAAAHAHLSPGACYDPLVAALRAPR